MSRPLRIEFPRALYHVMNRGNQKQDVFRKKSDCEAFIEKLDYFAGLFDVEVYCYVLMNNHFHLLLKTNEAKVAEYFDAPTERILRRKSQEKTARAVAIHFCSIYCNSRMTLTEIGKIFSLSLSGLTRTRDRVKDKLVVRDKELVKIKDKKINSGGVTLWYPNLRFYGYC